MALAAAALLLAAGAQPVSAGTSASSDITLRVGNTSQPPLFGRVSSDEPDCVAGRRVQIIIVAPQRSPLDFADDPTNAKGKWKFSSQLEGGTSFQAKVKPKKVSGITCEGATSPVRSF